MPDRDVRFLSCVRKSTLALLFLSLPIDEVLAFSTPSRFLAVRPASATTTLESFYMSIEEEEEEVYEEILDAGAFVSPAPPSYPPKVDEQLERDLRESERRIMLYEKEIEMVRDQLNLKQDELMEDQNLAREEKNSLMTKITEFTNILAQRDDELAAKTQRDSDTQGREAVLQKEMKSLSEQLDSISAAYQNEKKVSEALKTRFEDAQDSMEFEQMNFEKEKQALQATIDDEKKRLKSLENNLEENNNIFATTRKSLMEKISNEEAKLSSTKNSLSQTQEALKEVEKNLQESLNEKEEVLKRSQKDLKSERGLFEEERQDLKQQIRDEQTQVKNYRQELEEEKRSFEKSKKQLETLIKEEKCAVESLQNELSREQQKFESDRVRLEVRIKQESEKLAQVEEDLSTERDTFSKDKERLEKELENEIRVRKLKKRIMNERYEEIRKELTDLWEGSKRQARKEEARLKKKYEKKLNDVKKTVLQMEDDLDASKRSSDELMMMLEEMKQQKQRVIMEQQAMEARYKYTLAQRDTSVGDLMVNVENLRKTISDRDVVISEQKQIIDRYETSFRQVAKLSFVVTGNKVKSVGGAVKRFIQNSPPEDD